MNKKYDKMASDLAKAGRYGDDQIIHVSKAEVEGLGSLLPSGKLPNNPKTGQPEAFVITVPMLLAGLATGAATGGVAGGVTAKSRGIPLWEGILTGAGKGAATGLVTAGIGGALGGGAAPVVEGANLAASQAGNTLATGIEGVGSNIVPGLTDVASAAVDPIAIAPLVEPSAAAGINPPQMGELASFSPPAPTADFGGPGSLGSPISPADASSTMMPDPLSSVVTPDPLSADPGILEGMSESIQDTLGPNNTEYLNWLLDNPQLAMAPGMVELATGRSEWDEETYPEYDGPDPSWTTGPGTAESPSWSSSISSGSASSPSWAAKDGGPVVKRESDSKYDSNALGRMKSLIGMLGKVGNPTIPGRYNPLSDEDISMKIRPSMSGGMHRVGVTLPFRQGGLASNNPRSGGLGSLRRP